MEDYISLVNIWCQKNRKPFPKYTFQQFTNAVFFSCSAEADWITMIPRGGGPSKNQAKKECAKIIYTHHCKPTVEKVDWNGNLCILIDGDQRSDCWKWLAETQVQLSNNITTFVYVGPTTPIVNSVKENIDLVVTKSASRDAADAAILMAIGAFVANNVYDHYIIVSSDHILVNVALEHTNMSSAANLAQLKKLLVRE